MIYFLLSTVSRDHAKSVFLRGSASASTTISSTLLGHAEEHYTPEASCYAYRDPRPMQLLPDRTNWDAVWGVHVTPPLAVPAMSATVVQAGQA